MKKLLIIPFLLITSLAFANIKDAHIGNIITSDLRVSRSSVLGTRNTLMARQSSMVDVQDNFSGSIVGQDSTNIDNMIVDTQTLLDAIGVYLLSLDTKFQTIQK